MADRELTEGRLSYETWFGDNWRRAHCRDFAALQTAAEKCVVCVFVGGGGRSR
jgi:hypothetical protein